MENKVYVVFDKYGMSFCVTSDKDYAEELKDLYTGRIESYNIQSFENDQIVSVINKIKSLRVEMEKMKPLKTILVDGNTYQLESYSYELMNKLNQIESEIQSNLTLLKMILNKKEG